MNYMKQKKSELIEMQFEAGLLGKMDCTPEENARYIKFYKNNLPLPEGIFKYRDRDAFFMAKEFLSESERREYLALKQYKAIKTIRNCIIFFTVLVALGLVLTLLNF